MFLLCFYLFIELVQICTQIIKREKTKLVADKNHKQVINAHNSKKNFMKTLVYKNAIRTIIELSLAHIKQITSFYNKFHEVKIQCQCDTDLF